MRPTLKFLDENLLIKIISEAREVLCKLGVRIHNKKIISILSDHGAKIKNDQVLFSMDIIDKALKTVPNSFKLFDLLGNETHDFSSYNIYFTPGSTGINFLDPQTALARKPLTIDYIRFAKLVNRLPYIHSQSTAFIPVDVPEKISDSYRLYLSLLYCEKPVVTGAFTIESFELMKNFQIAIRGSEKKLKSMPLTIFSCCPTSPFEWSEVTSNNLIDCAKYSIPIEIISMPLSGFIAPVTLVGTLIQHTAETLSGVIISQMVNPGTPLLYGGSPAIFDIKHETTPMGAIETMMIDCAYNEIGKYLHIPTQAYISLSDSKLLDAQAGFETSMGATLAALSGINNISGPGMLDFENCISLEKLVLDNEICGMVLRMVKGIEPREDFPSLPRFEELLHEKHLLISDHTRKYFNNEIFNTGEIINRTNRSRWECSEKLTLFEKARKEVDRLVGEYTPSRLSSDVKNQIKMLMKEQAEKYGQLKLPVLPD
jgi:trimethylamine--corrinoid protein Co-methyltransferase